ncbi:MAG: hypothetical protein ACJ789_09690 [Thermomicrobiales bacterium]
MVRAQGLGKLYGITSFMGTVQWRAATETADPACRRPGPLRAQYQVGEMEQEQSAPGIIPAWVVAASLALNMALVKITNIRTSAHRAGGADAG